MNGTWQSVNQTLCGSAETAELQEIYKAATASVSGSENTVAENFKMQVRMVPSSVKSLIFTTRTEHY